MVLRKLRWLSAALLAAVAALAAPSRASADTQILIQEFNSANAQVGATGIFTPGTLPGGANPSYSPSGSSFNVTSIGVTPIVSFDQTSTTLSTTVITTPTGSFDAGNYLKVTVTSDGFVNPNAGGTGTLVNDPGISSSRASDTNSNTGTTQLLAAGGIPVAGAALSDTESTSQVGASTKTVSSLPSPFAIQQTLTIRITPNGGLNGSFTDTLSSSLDTTPPPATAVPAPAGLLLALAAVPVFGLRRVFRRKAAQA